MDTALFIHTAFLIWVYMTFVFLLGLVKKDNGIVDIAWGMGFILVALFTSYVDYTLNIAQMIMVTLVLIWGLRLSLHIFMRHLGKPEDYRYANWRKEWGKWVHVRAYLQVYMLQGLIMLLVASPVVLIAMADLVEKPWFMHIGLMIWIIGFFFEVVADYQVEQFKKHKKKGEILMTGLWKYSRHPNYFGEATMWWGIWCIVLSTEYGVYGVISPLLITFLVRFVSGVPMLERKYKGREDYAAYAKKTNAFIPWFPKG